MGIGILVAVGFAAYLIWALTRTGTELAPVTTRRPVSPLDEAERIVAGRYARGEISAEEYQRMLVILRR